MPETIQSTRTAEPTPTTAPNRSLPPRRQRGRVWLGRLTRLFSEPVTREECRCRNPFGEVGEGAEVVLDVRGLSLEGQTGRTLERMEVLPADKRLRHINTLVPWPLLAMLETRGYRYRLVGRKEGAVQILIWGATPAR